MTDRSQKIPLSALDLDGFAAGLGKQFGAQIAPILRRLESTEPRLAALEREVAELRATAANARRRAISATPDPDFAGSTLITFDDGVGWSVPDERLARLAGLRALGRA